MAQCDVIAANQTGAVREGQSLRIGSFAFIGQVEYDPGPPEELAAVFTDALHSELEAAEYFGRVITASDDVPEPADTDLVLEGEFVDIDEGLAQFLGDYLNSLQDCRIV